jgi:hypothetical protein
MNIILFVYIFLLFVLLTPGILLSLPPKGSKWTVAIVHGLVFALVWCLTNKYVWEISMMLTQPEPSVVVKI